MLIMSTFPLYKNMVQIKKSELDTKKNILQ